MDYLEKRDKPSITYILITFSVVFFTWGLLTVLNEVLIDQLIRLFELSYTASTLIDLTFFSTYLIVALKAGSLIKKIGYKKGILTGWMLATIGCFVFFAAIKIKAFELVLSALFLQAAGITILQVACNLYVVLYGSSSTSASRLNFVQAFNSLGTVIPSYFLVIVLTTFIKISENSRRYISSGKLYQLYTLEDYIHVPYIVLGSLMALFAIYLCYARIPDLSIEHQEPLNRMPYHPRRHVMHFPQLRLGAFAIFAYVGAEVSLHNYLVDFAKQNDAYYLGLAMIGRLAGAFLLTKVGTRQAVGFAAGMACLLVILAILTSGMGNVPIWSITLVGLFNSILFPSIFSLGINGLGKFSLNGSAVLIMSIVGGAVISFMVRNFSLMKGFPPELSRQLAFIIPVICYAYIVLYGLKLSRFPKREVPGGEVQSAIA